MAKSAKATQAETVQEEVVLEDQPGSQELVEEVANDQPEVVEKADVVPEETLQEVVDVALVSMVRDQDQYEAPHEAEVHPDEVENYKAGGWTEAK
jgi:hypothetical protein